MHDITRNMFQLLIRLLHCGTTDRVFFKILLPAAIIVTAHGCSSVRDKQGYAYGKNPVQADPLFEERISGLDPEHISEEDLKDILSRFPAPRIININGSPSPPEDLSAEDTRNILFAAEQCFYIKKYWCLELRKLVESRRGDPGQ